MNSGTLVGSLIFVAVLVVTMAVVIQSMMRGWRYCAGRQVELIGALPSVPAADDWLKLGQEEAV